MSRVQAKTTFATGLFLLVLALAVPSAQASQLSPGQTAPPDVLGAPWTGTIMATTSGTIAPGTFSTSYTVWVVADPNNVFCAGCLDFAYVFTNAGPGVNERFTGFDFTGYKVDVGYDPTTGSHTPTTVDRTTSGAVIGFNYTGTDEITAGETTPLLLIETNALNFTDGLVSVQDGSAGTGEGFAPFGPVSAPEPATLALLGSGLLAGGFFRRFRK